MPYDVRDNREHHRFELEVDGHLAIAQYRLEPGIITFLHTEVPKELEGRGIGSALARAALDGVRAEGLKVVARCPFIASYIARHKEFADLLLVTPEPSPRAG